MISGRRIQLQLSEAAFMEHPPYTEDHFEAPHDLLPNQFDLTDIARAEQEIAARLPTGVPGTWIARKRNKTFNDRDVAAGMPVWRQSPQDEIGHVE